MAKTKGVRYWKKRATALWSDLIREVGECEICGREGKRGKTQGWTNLDAHHLIPKGTSDLFRCDLSNGVCLCVRCHQWDEGVSPHQNKEGFEKWLETMRPGQWKWYNRNYPLEDEKQIGNITVPTRIVKKYSGKIDWEKIYYELKGD